jgi:hypothetical protein
VINNQNDVFEKKFHAGFEGQRGLTFLFVESRLYFASVFYRKSEDYSYSRLLHETLPFSRSLDQTLTLPLGKSMDLTLVSKGL